MANSNDMGVSERVTAGIGFSVGDYHLGRLDRWSDSDLNLLQINLEGLVQEADITLQAISLIQEARYDTDTAARKGQFAIE